jgi:hypothetical protein
MGLTSNVVGNTPILSSWGNEVRDRSVQVFANAAERTAQWTAPPTGAVSYLVDQPGLMWVFVAGAWKAPNAMGIPSGGYITSATGVQIPPASTIDLPSMAFTFTPVANRKIKITGSLQTHINSGTPATAFTLYITDSANTIFAQRSSWMLDNASFVNQQTLTVFHVMNSTGAAISLKLRANNYLGSAVGLYTDFQTMIVEDVGPV